MASIEELANTLRRVATSGMKPKALLAAVREKYPEATKKEVIRAAFYALAESQSGDHSELHSFALAERCGDEDDPVRAAKLRRKKKDRQTEPEVQAPH
ncbi:hypothetical protein [Methylorubrum suomiense]|uniref:Uncharacterized protein n=1 Tax=Methylorubrum suomiense TaxID=144191 RepID=A0ABQ4UQY2_9HYPH|nr:MULTISPECIES: hypothetical protein [Methylobacteriaceae]GJE74080.1 hypothetical protein BGCPKDLD_0648 [Methylorubrum suomiense]